MTTAIDSQTGKTETDFRRWFSIWSRRAGLDPDPDHPAHNYDFRAAFRAGITPTMDPRDNRLHWDSRFKREGHPNQIINGVNTITGEKVIPNLKPTLLNSEDKDARDY